MAASGPADGLEMHITSNSILSIKMKQDHPRFVSFNGDIQMLAASMALGREEIDLSMPIVYGSTGAWTLLVPIKKLSSFNDMKPNNKLFPDVLRENPRASLHPFCLGTYDKTAFIHALRIMRENHL